MRVKIFNTDLGNREPVSGKKSKTFLQTLCSYIFVKNRPREREREEACIHICYSLPTLGWRNYKYHRWNISCLCLGLVSRAVRYKWLEWTASREDLSTTCQLSACVYFSFGGVWLAESRRPLQISGEERYKMYSLADGYRDWDCSSVRENVGIIQCLYNTESLNKGQSPNPIVVISGN